MFHHTLKCQPQVFLPHLNGFYAQQQRILRPNNEIDVFSIQQSNDSFSEHHNSEVGRVVTVPINEQLFDLWSVFKIPTLSLHTLLVRILTFTLLYNVQNCCEWYTPDIFVRVRVHVCTYLTRMSDMVCGSVLLITTVGGLHDSTAIHHNLLVHFAFRDCHRQPVYCVHFARLMAWCYGNIEWIIDVNIVNIVLMRW